MGDPDDRTAKTYYLIDATNAPEAELRVLAWIHHDYADDLQYAVASADSVEQEASRWRVEVEWDARPRT
ncbi:hypothetical protein ABZ897_50665 [Nonomuraea sp. NPDC046802]|uniref:hypothetical protein n=1 Tax=Nonomuraea sp. NPDC046802 TaxID=3154919 RepID=UPI0033E75E78